MTSLAVAFALARRELRGGLKGFRIFLACLAIGVAAIAGVGSLSAGLGAGIRADARSLLGGDVHLRLSHRPATPAQIQWLEARGEVSTSREMRAMARAEGGTHRTLVEIKAVDGRYPLYGAVALDPAGPLAEALAEVDGVPGAAVDANLLGRLDLRLGDRLRIGDLAYQVRATIAQEPDRGSTIFTLGPRVMVSVGSLAATGLVQTGSLIRYDYRIRLDPGASPHRYIADLKAAFPDAGWRIRDFTNAAPEVQRFINRVSLFLTLVGLTALLVGGIGVGNAVKSYLEGKTATIATLKCLGATGPMVFRIYFIQIMIMALGGIGIGLLLGGLAPVAAGRLLEGLFPFSARLGLYPGPLILACAYGLLTAIAFALWPLARARDISAAGLFRDLVAPGGRWPRPIYVMATILAALALVWLSVAMADERRIAAWFVFGATAGLIVFTLAAIGLRRLARAAGGVRRPVLRLAIANLHRPGAPTTSMVLSLGFGLAVLVTIAVVEQNLSREVTERLPRDAPSFFFIDIQPDQVEAFDRVVRATPGVTGLQRVPSLRGRIVELAGVPAEQVKTPPGHRWVLRNDRGLTYARTLPPGSTLVEGEWWPADYDGPPLISMDAHIAEGFGLRLGDSITLNILGRRVSATIASFRTIDWSSLGINFVLVFAPGTLEGAPQTHIATVRVARGAEEVLEQAVTARFANVSSIRVREALDTVHGILRRIAIAIRATAGITLLAGVLVLAGAIAASHRRRVYDAVVLKVLGATRRDIARSYLIEHLILGSATAIIAAVVGSVAGWAVLTQVMNATFRATPGAVALVAGAGVVITLALGFVGTWRALGQKAAPVLRTE